jgi:deoxyribodipyrimidine photo-lyase
MTTALDDTAQFPPTPEAIAARLSRLDVARYGRTRNALDGAVTGLSPYVTHGLIDPPDIVAAVQARTALSPQDKFLMQLGWREFFAHVWRQEGERILRDLRPAISSQPYARALPDDVLQARTGAPVIDQAVRQLYATGYLHNHARLWLASYVVHLRKVHWRVGADWLYGHLLDGDLASNHLSWQWVAGTFSVKPYLFNAENVARYAPPAWHTPSTVIDTSYEQLDQWARNAADCGPEPVQPEATLPPALLAEPPAASLDVLRLDDAGALPSPVQLIHPWSLCEPAATGTRLGVIHAPFHARFPWSARRWTFVIERLRACTEAVWIGDLAVLLRTLRGRALHARDTQNPGYAEALRSGAVQLTAVPRLFDDPARSCRSFSQFYAQQIPGRWHQ